MAMYTARTISGPPSEWMNPPFRKVWFDDSPAVVLVSTHLRHAWTALPPTESPTLEAIGAFIKANHELPPEQRDQLPQNRDKDSIDSAWRDKVYEFWTHVFVDVSRFLEGVGGDMGHVHPQNYEHWGFEYPASCEGDQSGVEEELGKTKTKKKKTTTRVWDTNVLLIPAHLEPDVSLRATITQTGEDGTTGEAELGTFDASNPTEIWYLRKGVEVNVYVEGDYEKGSEGVAAVLAVGMLCLAGPKGDEEEAEERGEERLQKKQQAEAVPSEANVMALAASHQQQQQQEGRSGSGEESERR